MSGQLRGEQMLVSLALAAAAALTAEDILDRAAEAAGGTEWLNAKTLVLEGTAVFYGPASPEPRSRASEYRMWRVFDPERQAAHGAEGKVRILACDGERRLFTVGYDGATTWTERGVTPKAEADAFWASNFGFGIIRPLYMVRLTDPSGTQTLFGIDQQSFAIRMMGFASPRGWHVRTYDDFYRLPGSPWLQARRVTLYYNGVKSNEVTWTAARVNLAIDDQIFTPSSSLSCGGAK
jgi:hypothetical protein